MTSDDPTNYPRKEPSTPISDALARLNEHEVDHAFTSEQILASLLNIRGSVDLEKFLAGDIPILSGTEKVPVEVILAQTGQGIEDVRARLEQSFGSAYRPRYRLPRASGAWAVLERTGYLAARQGGEKKPLQKSLRSATRIIWAPFSEFLETRIKRSRFALQELREKLGPLVAGLSSASAELERLDRVLRLAIDPEVRSLYQRVGKANEKRFSVTLSQALSELPEVAENDGFKLGFCEEGWLGTVFGASMEMVVAIIEHEIQQLETFIRTAIALPHDDAEKTE